MSYRQWDVVKVRVNPNDRDEHPAVVLSPDEVAGDSRYLKVNVLYGTTKRPRDSIRPGQFHLDTADGAFQRDSRGECAAGDFQNRYQRQCEPGSQL
jgi:hypothetical protein